MGKVALVTGGAQGIGFAISQRLARDGAAIGILDINEEGAEKAAKELATKGIKAVGIRCDITSLESAQAAVARAEELLGPATILVNNAGWSTNKPFIESSAEERAKIIAINYVGVLNCTYAALGGMIERQSGRIVCIASDAARVGTPREAVYAGAKNGVIGFVKSLAAEVARYNITVNAVSPSSTATPLIMSILTQEQLDRRVKAIPMRRLAKPEDQAAAVAFFASDETGYITGQVLSVNGGSSRLG